MYSHPQERLRGGGCWAGRQDHGQPCAGTGSFLCSSVYVLASPTLQETLPQESLERLHQSGFSVSPLLSHDVTKHSDAGHLAVSRLVSPGQDLITSSGQTRPAYMSIDGKPYWTPERQ